jgi:hypothetical protein
MGRQAFQPAARGKSRGLLAYYHSITKMVPPIWLIVRVGVPPAAAAWAAAASPPSMVEPAEAATVRAQSRSRKA